MAGPCYIFELGKDLFNYCIVLAHIIGLDSDLILRSIMDGDIVSSKTVNKFRIL